MSAVEPRVAQIPSLRGEYIEWVLQGQEQGAWRAVGPYPHKTVLVAPAGSWGLELQGSNDREHVALMTDTLGLPIKGAGIYPVEAHVLWVRPVNHGANPVVVQLLAYREGM